MSPLTHHTRTTMPWPVFDFICGWRNKFNEVQRMFSYGIFVRHLLNRNSKSRTEKVGYLLMHIAKQGVITACIIFIRPLYIVVIILTMYLMFRILKIGR